MSDANNYTGITVDTLNNKSHRRFLADLIRKEIKEIDYKIQTAHDLGYNIANYNLCTNIMVNAEDIPKAQMYIYSELIQSYQKRGFLVKIKLGDNPTLICKWENKMCDEDLAKHQKIISDNLLR